MLFAVSICFVFLSKVGVESCEVVRGRVCRAVLKEVGWFLRSEVIRECVRMRSNAFDVRYDGGEVVSVMMLSWPRDASCDAFRDCLAVRIHLGFATHAHALSCARMSRYSHWTPREGVNPSSH